MAPPPDRLADVVVVVLVGTSVLVLVAVVGELIVRTEVDPVDRALTLASLGAIGTTLAAGVASWLKWTARRRRDDDDQADDDDTAPPTPVL